MEKNERLKILRILSGLSQDGLAKKIGVPQATVSAWESGKYLPSRDHLSRLSYSLSSPSSYISHGSPAIPASLWTPFSPRRKDYLSAVLADISYLFPLFLKENGFNGLCVDTLSDGRSYFMFSRRLYVGWLLISDRVQKQTFIDAASQTLDSKSIVFFDHRFGHLDIDVLHSTGAHWCQVKKIEPAELIIDRSLAVTLLRMHAKETGQLTIGVDSLRVIFRAFAEVIPQYALTEQGIIGLEQLFTEKCNELSSVMPPNINIYLLMSEIRNTLMHHGCCVKNTSE